tara:strand:+ start:75 stop:407 length:333 start_codon:yes stop_codon:yes gene_type:complete
MAVNRHRGEVPAIIDGRERTLCLTLGALAELEDAFAADSLAGLVERFGTGRLSARDLTRILAAGLRGGGTDITRICHWRAITWSICNCSSPRHGRNRTRPPITVSCGSGQ